MRNFAAMMLISSLLICGCQIETTAPSPRGMLEVIAEDTSGAPIVGAAILLDSVPQAETTPALLGPLDAGDYRITIRDDIHIAYEDTVTVPAGDTAHMHARMPLSPICIITVNSNPSGARIIVDERFAIDSSSSILITPTSFAITTAYHEITVALDSHRTVSPALCRLTVKRDTTVAFQLQAAAIGNTIGALPFAFRKRLILNDTTRFDSLSSDQLRGHPAMMTCWFTSCEPCRLELPYFGQVYNEYASRGVRFIALTTPVPGNQPLAAMMQAMVEVGMPFPAAIDPQPGFWMQMRPTPQSGYPLNVFVDSTGAVVHIGGAMSETELRQLVQSQLP